jgi:hypothetical protein
MSTSFSFFFFPRSKVTFFLYNLYCKLSSSARCKLFFFFFQKKGPRIMKCIEKSAGNMRTHISTYHLVKFTKKTREIFKNVFFISTFMFLGEFVFNTNMISSFCYCLFSRDWGPMYRLYYRAKGPNIWKVNIVAKLRDHSHRRLNKMKEIKKMILYLFFFF